MTIARHCGGTSHPTMRRDTVPLDWGDFGRCYRLVEKFPRLRDNFPKLVAEAPEWSPIIVAWDELCEVFRKGICKFTKFDSVVQGRLR